VVAFHAFPGRFAGGFVGVDIFFVISGFLISSILFENLARSQFDFLEFYRRRIARIFPALITVLLSCAAAGALLLMADEYQQLGKHIAAGGGFVSNFALWGESGYFDNAADTKPLLHLWSLGVEEQYYLLWPALLWGAWRLRLNLLTVTLLVATLSFGWNVAEISTHPVAAFYSPQSRFWELLIGALLANLTSYRSAATSAFARRFGHLAASLGFALLILALALLTKDREFPGWWALVPTLGAALIIAAGPRALPNRALAHPALVWVGLISFPLYLWHWPLLAFAHIVAGATPSATVRLAAVFLAVLLAWGTVRLIEKPLRFGGKSWRKAGVLLLLMALTVALGGLIYCNQGVPDRTVARATKEYSVAQHDWGYTVPRFAEGRIEITVLAGKEPQRVLFVGDSLMGQYYPRIESRYARAEEQPFYSSVFVARDGCRPLPHGATINKTSLNCDAYYAAVMALAQDPLYKRIVVSASWELMFSRESMKSNLAQLTADFGRLRAAGKEIVFITLAPHGEEFEPLRLARMARLQGLGLGGAVQRDRTVAQSLIPDDAEALSAMRQFAQGVGARLIDSRAVFCRDGECPTLQAGKPWHTDNYHLRATTVRENATFLDPLLEDAAP
jgi:peptidoglycan/LPS O-acetylase OafA/YrhL